MHFYPHFLKLLPLFSLLPLTTASTLPASENQPKPPLPHHSQFPLTTPSTTNYHKPPIPLEIHIMSKCPDAQQCMSSLIHPLLQTIPHHKLAFKISFIGKINPTNGGVTCMHGVGECLGNMVHLCAEELYPWTTTAKHNEHTFLSFSQCLLSNYARLPGEEFIEHCANVTSTSFTAINSCISSLEPTGGVELLRKSCGRSEEAGIRTSCTVRVAEKIVCVRDGGKWVECGEGGKYSTVEGLGGLVGRLYDEQEASEEMEAGRMEL